MRRRTPVTRLLLPVTLSLFPVTSFADVSVSDVWKSWKDDLAVMGAGAVTVGVERREGDSLIIEDMVVTLSDPDINLKATLDTLRFSQNADGTVSVTLPDTMPVVIIPTLGAQGDQVTVEISFGDMAMTVSGDPSVLTYDIASDRTALTITEALDRGDPVPVGGTIFVNALTGSYTNSTSLPQIISYEFGFGSLDLLFEFAEDDAQFNLTSQITDFSQKTDAVLPAGFAYEVSADALTAGLEGQSTYSYGPSQTLITYVEDGQPNSAIITGDGGSTFASVDEERLALASTFENLNVEIRSMLLPAPATVSLGDYKLSFDTPLARSATPVPFSAALGFSDLQIDDLFWNMIDPAGNFENSPINFNLSLSGTMRLLFDLLDPDQVDSMMGADVPAEVHSLAIEGLELSGAGAEITGSGAFDLDYNRPGPIPDMPSAQGSAIIEAKGINALLEKLAAMGMLPQDQIMGARMMLGMFANVIGPDELRSTLEINENGHVIINGQRIQ